MGKAKTLDPSTLSKPERIVAAASWLGVINAAIPWWFRAHTSSGTETFNAGLTYEGLLVYATFGAAAALVLIRAWIWPQPAPRRDGTLYALLGIGTLVALSARTLGGAGSWIGPWVALVLSVAVTAAGFVRRRERQRGWA